MSRGRIEGRIYNAETGRYLNRAQVRIAGTTAQTFTNQFGEYEFYSVPAGEVTVVVDYTGQATQRAEVTVEPGQAVRRDFTLGIRARPLRQTDGEEEVIELDDFEVKAADNFQNFSELAIQEERFSVNLKNVVAADAYGIIAQGNVGEFVKYIPGVDIDYGGTYASGADATAIRIRGYSAEQTQITIDGIPIANAQPGSLSPAVGLDMLSINNASRIEVIKVPTPDQPSAGLGGTVNLVSKSAFEYSKPSVRLRVYASMNSENVDDLFRKTPGPMSERTYKTLPGFDFTYAHPVNEKFGFTLTLASANQANENQSVKTDWRTDPDYGAEPSGRDADDTFTLGGSEYNYWLTEDPRFTSWQNAYGSDWTEWSESDFRAIYAESGATDAEIDDALRNVKRVARYDEEGNLVGALSPSDRDNQLNNLPIWYDADGNELGPVYFDHAHPYLNNVSVTDSPRTSNRHSAAIKLDFRPFEGLLLTGNYQLSTFEDQDAGRRFEINAGGNRGTAMFGPDFIISRDGFGKSEINLTALDKDGITHSGYLRGSYIKGPWNIGGHVSYSRSEGNLVSTENGHFSGIEARMGNIDRAEFYDIDGYGVPGEVRFYTYNYDEEGNKTGEERMDAADLSNYNIPGVDTENPQASRLRVLAGNTDSTSEIKTGKLDIRRDLDFIRADFMNLAVKAGVDWEERKETKEGRGTNYAYQYIGSTGQVLRLDDFRDEYYVDVDPGFGFEPREWPDLNKLYDFFQDHPEVFSDTYDEPFLRQDGSVEGNTVAADNYINLVNTEKSMVDTKTAYYVQLEGQFLNNRLTVVGGLRFENREREGRRGYRDRQWNLLRRDVDEDNNALLDVFRNYDELTPEQEALLPASWFGELPVFNVTRPPLLNEMLAEAGVDSYDQLDPVRQDRLTSLWQIYEGAGTYYADGSAFTVDSLFNENGDYAPIIAGTLAATQLEYIRNYRIDEKQKSRPRPIVSVAYDITDRLVVRGSWALRYANEPYEGNYGILRQIEYRENSDGLGGLVNVTNPNLDISKTNQFDLGLAYYTESGGKFSVNGYFAVEENRRINVSYTAGGNRERWEEVMSEIGFGPGTRYWEQEWDVSTAINSQGTYYRYGYELEARQDLGVLGDWGRHFYVFAGFTHKFESQGDVEEDEENFFSEPLEDEIDASGGLAFNFKRFNAQFNWTWRSDRIMSYSEGIIWADPTLGNPAWYQPGSMDGEDDPYRVQLRSVQPSEFRLDVTMAYRLTDRYTIDFAARNVTNSHKSQRLESVLPGYPPYAAYETRSNYGVNFTLGVTAQF